MAVDNNLFFTIYGLLVLLFYIFILKKDSRIFNLASVVEFILAIITLYGGIVVYNSLKENLDFYQRGLADSLAITFILIIFIRASDRKLSELIKTAELFLEKVSKKNQSAKKSESSESKNFRQYELSTKERQVLEAFYSAAYGEPGSIVRLNQIMAKLPFSKTTVKKIVIKLCKTGHLSIKPMPESYGITTLGVSYLHVMQ